MNKGRQKRSLSIHGHRTSISLEPEFWEIIDEAATNTSLAAFITSLDDKRTKADSVYGLAAYLRIFALEWVRWDDQ